MQATIEEVGPCKRRLKIEVPTEEVNEALRNGMGDLQKSAAIPGFRRGHAPLALLEKRFGGELRRDVKSRLVVENYRKALDENSLHPIADPEIDLDSIEMNDGEALSYDLTVEVWPDFDPEGYEGMKLEKSSGEPTDEEIESEIDALRMRTTRFEEIEEGAAEEKDFLLCDYSIVIDDEEVASAKDVGVRPTDDVVGRFKVPGLKKAGAGAKTGDTLNVDFKVDADHFQEDIRGKEAKVTLNVKGIRRPNTPEATDEWAKELGFASLDELKEVVTRNAAATKEQAAEQNLRAQVYQRLVEMMQFDLPQDAVRRQQKEIMRREQLGLQYRGATEEDLAKISGKLEEASLERAERNLKTFFILSRIAEKENIQATPADVEMRIAELATRYRTTAAKMRQQLEREGMLAEIVLEVQEEKTVSHILSKAEISEAAGEKKSASKPKKPRVKKQTAQSSGKGGKAESKKAGSKKPPESAEAGQEGK